MENQQHLKPHCVNLPIGIVSEIKNKYHTSASSFIRNAVISAMNGENSYEEGYRDGLKEAAFLTQTLESKIKAKANGK
jgi:hypothetical protein